MANTRDTQLVQCPYCITRVKRNRLDSHIATSHKYDWKTIKKNKTDKTNNSPVQAPPSYMKPVKVVRSIKAVELETTLRRQKECLHKRLCFEGIPSDYALARLKEACEDLIRTIQEVQTTPIPKSNDGNRKALPDGAHGESVRTIDTGQTRKPGSHRS